MIQIGLMGEHYARNAQIDITEFMTMWPDTEPQLFVVRPGETEPYIAVTQRNGNALTWVINAYDTEKRGTGKAQVLFAKQVDNDIVILGKSPVYNVSVGNALEGTEAAEIPDPYNTWAAVIAGYAATATQQAEAAAEAAEHAEQVANNCGFIDVEIDERGHLIYTKSPTTDIDMEITDAGNLVVTIGTEV